RHGVPSKLSRRPDSFSELQSNYRKLAGAVEVARWAGHIISLDGQPAIIAALTIVPNVNMSLLKGTPNLLVSITYIDQPFISEIGRSLLLNDLTLLSSPVRRYGVVSEPFAVDDGGTAGYLSWTTRRPGQVLLTIILPLVALGTIATGILSMTMLRRLRRTSEELAKRESQARYEAKHDSLSGLPNRISMVEKIERFLLAADRGEQRAIAAYIDIDRFKDINDTLGHDAGDQLIKAVAARLKKRLGPKEFLARFGGDEFVILTVPAAPRGSAAVAERVAQAFISPFVVNGQNIRVTASVGIAFAPDNGVSADELMRHADIALYRAKNTGRDRAVTFTAEMAQEVEHRRSIELDLREALESDALRLNYQPLISCRTGEICGIEALLRWNHPTHGAIAPADFIPIAESSGLLPAVGEWVLERAMSDSTRWPDIEIAINLSPVQFRHLDIDKTLRALVAKHGIDPRRFVLEITEGVLLEASDRTVSILDDIRRMGFKIALDDFGTRYSSLAYLCNFKFDKIKIDRSFIRSISKVETSRRIVQSVITLSRGLGIDVVAEGVETESEAAIMTHFGCTELQGYYFSRPIDADQMADFLILFQPKPIVAQVRAATG
ncbi:MAG: EAL domain-containing protein, partial [Candidatus Udaeobacter sp.]